MAGLMARANSQGKLLALAVKSAVTVTAFVVLSRYVDFNVLVARIRAFEPSWIVFAIALAVVQVMLVGFRWNRIIAAIRRPSDSALSGWEVQAINWISQFISQFIPFIFGDMLRILLLQQAGTSLRTAFKSALLDRGIAVAVLFLLSAFALLLAPAGLAENPYFQPALVAVLFGIICIAIVLVFAEQVAVFAARWWMLAILVEVLRDVTRILKSRPSATFVIGSCIAVHLISIIVFWLLTKGLAADLSLRAVFVVVPLMLLLSMAPISFGGWGVREGFVVWLLVGHGVDAEGALLLSLAFGSVILVATLPGVLMLILSLRPSPTRSASRILGSPRVSAE